MTLLYLNIPVETSKVTNAENMKIEIKNQIVNWLEKQKAAIKPTVFEFAEDTKVLMGKNKDRSFITALFVPSQGTPSLRNTLLLPLAQALYPLYPYAWIGFLENPDYHISLLKLLSGCLTEKVIYPNPLPAVELFKFSSGKLKVSVSGANSWGMTSKIINW